MKKGLILFVVMIFMLTACSSQSGKPAANTASSVSSVLQQQINGSSEAETAAPTEQPSEAPATAPAQDAQVDLTNMSSTMVYSEVYNMMTNPDDYMGKTVKAQGNFAVYHDEITDKYYYACMIADAAACCSQGLEFVLTEERAYPEDYPELGTEITIFGVFDTYEEAGQLYCQLIDATMA